MAITLKVGDIGKSLIKRSLTSNAFDYEGENIELQDLSTAKSRTYALTLSQTIDLEEDEGKNCRNYPNKNFTSYRECDENFVYNEVKNNYNMMPFWAARSMDEITDIMY